MNKISLKTVREILRDNELKNILGGSGDDNVCSYTCNGNPESISCNYGECKDLKTSAGVVYGIECVAPPGSGGGKIECLTNG